MIKDKGGFIKLWRKSLDSHIYRNIKVWHFWTYCLLKASHKKREALVGNTQIFLSKGQFIFGRKIAAKETGLSEQGIRTCLKVLKKAKNLTIKSTNKFSIITIVNWGDYQSEENQSTTKSTNSQPASNQQVTTDKNVKNVKNVKNKEKKEKKENLKFYLQEKIKGQNLLEVENKIIEFYNYRMDMPSSKKYKSTKGINGLFRNIDGCQKQNMDINTCLDIAMERNWLTPDPSYYKNLTNFKYTKADKNKEACLNFINGN